MHVRIGDLNVNYEVAGNGHPIVLIHSAGSSLSHFDLLAPELAKNFTVYRYDLRGFGKTERPDDPHLSFALWQSDLSAFLTHFNIKKVALVGHSPPIGVRIAWLYALRHPEQVSHLILTGATLPGDRTAPDHARAVIMKDVTPEVAADPFTYAKGLFSRHTHEHNPELIERARAERSSANERSGKETRQADAVEPNLTVDELKKLSVPTLLIAGEDDMRGPIAQAEELHKVIPNSTVKTIPNCGHYYALEQPEAVAAAITAFVKR